MRPIASALVDRGAGIGREPQVVRLVGEGPAAEHQHQFEEQDAADHRAHRRVALEALAQPGEVDVQHHDDEQEQHRDRADIDDDQDHRQELGAGDQEQRRGVEEGEDQEQHAVDRIARRDHHDRRGDQDGREEIEGERGDHRVPPGRCCIMASSGVAP